MREISNIIIHCSATPPDMNIGADQIREWHVQGNGWDDIGYHWVIRRGGTIDAGRDEAVQGAHAYGYNSNSIGICLVGGVDHERLPDCNYTAEQWVALEGVVLDILERYPDAAVIGHRDVSSKDCPCFDVGAWACHF